MHPPPAAENSFHPVPSLVLSSVPTEDVLRRRKKDYGFARLLFAIWSMLALVLLAQFALLLFGGWSSILKLFVIMHAPAIDLVYLLIPCGAGIYIGYAMWQGVDQFFRIRAFRKLYDTCRSIDPVRLARCRLAHVMLQRPSRFTYAFSSSKMVVCVGNKQAQEKPQDAPGIDALEGTEDTLNLPTSTAQGQEWQAARPIIGESTLVPTLSVVEAEGKQEEGLASGRDREPDVTGVERKLGFLVRIHQSVSLALVEERGTGSPESVETTQKEVSLLGNIYYEALVARLAIRGKEKVESNKLMKEIYGNRIEEKRSMQQLFYDDKRRIDAQIKKCLERWFPEMAASMDRFKLFEHSKKLWYLSSRCVVRGAEILNYWYRKIKAMRQGDDRSVIPEQELQSIASRLIKEYSRGYLDKNADEEGYTGGYLLQKLHEDAFASWAPEFFRECRTQYIYVLTYIAECMYRLGVSKQEPGCIAKAARYYKECAYAATCAPVDGNQGEKALRSCVEMYMYNQDTDSAEEVLKIYAKRMGKAVSGWDPAPATKEMIKRHNLVYD